nr:hypothetical protein GCM10025730_15500 [Promicromonospora thailandica]
MVRSSAIQGGQGDAGGSAHGTGDNLQLVGREGTITGTEAARQLGISQALASRHLR